VLRIVGVNEATYYYRKKNSAKKPKVHAGGRPIPGYSLTKEAKPISDEQIKEWLLELVAGEENAYGYHKLTLCLKNEYGLIINKKKVYRLCKELDILEPQRQKIIKHPRRIAINREITAPNQLWEMDIKYGYIAGESRFLYLLGVIDVFDRTLIDYHIGLSCEGKDAAKLIQRCLWKRKLLVKENKPIIRTDNGPQFVSNIFGDACNFYEIEHERIPPRTPNKNAHIESFHAILERECLSRYEFNTYQEAYQVITEFIQFYNKRRIHGSIKNLSPEVYSQQVTNGKILGMVVRV
jgi:putative transposase